MISKTFSGIWILLTNRHEKKPNSCTMLDEKRNLSLVDMFRVLLYDFPHKMGFDRSVRSLILLGFLQLVRTLVPFVDGPDEGSQLPDCVASPGMSEALPLGSRSPPRAERDKTAGRVGLAPGVAFSPLHHIPGRVNFCGAPEQGTENHLVQIQLAMSGRHPRRGGPSWSRSKTYSV